MALLELGLIVTMLQVPVARNGRERGAGRTRKHCEIGIRERLWMFPRGTTR